MNTNKITTLKNLVWALGIVICLVFVAVGMIFVMFRRYKAPDQSYDYSLYNTAETAAADLSSGALGSGNSRGALHLLGETADGGDSYVNRMVFLVDSTYIGLRDLGLINSNQVWGSPTGSLKMENLPNAVIRYPNDGSEISPVSAAMISKPDIMVIAIGEDGLANVDENTFITYYDNLVNEIKSASPDTLIICCGLPSIIPGYNGSDGLTVTRISDGNDWVQLVCRDTQSYFLNVQEDLSESVQLYARYASSNGKTLNRAGLEVFLRYLRTHAIPR
ncbi:MAG: SGNH/GDSL hydrolase family protein [Oscillospiraceae bacterium]|nr:SGNH/GDSL hydrolase family protein [Oscillospiraceae bacterium]